MGVRLLVHLMIVMLSCLLLHHTAEEAAVDVVPISDPVALQFDVDLCIRKKDGLDHVSRSDVEVAADEAIDSAVVADHYLYRGTVVDMTLEA